MQSLTTSSGTGLWRSNRRLTARVGGEELVDGGDVEAFCVHFIKLERLQIPPPPLRASPSPLLPGG